MNKKEIYEANMGHLAPWLKEVTAFLDQHCIDYYNASGLMWKANAKSICAKYFQIESVLESVNNAFEKDRIPSKEELLNGSFDWFMFLQNYYDGTRFIEAWKDRVAPVAEFIDNLTNNIRLI